MNVTTDNEIKNRYNQSVIPSIKKNIDSSKNKIKNNEKDINLQNENLRDFWVQYFKAQEATVTRFLPIEG